MDHYLRKLYLKTVSLMANACEAAAATSDANDDRRALAYKFGTNLGLAFQVRHGHSLCDGHKPGGVQATKQSEERCARKMWMHRLTWWLRAAAKGIHCVDMAMQSML